MPSESVVAELQNMEFTRDLKPEHLEKLASLATEVEFAEGETVFREGDVGETVYLIQEGMVALDSRMRAHGRMTILTVGPGQLLGWSSLFAPMRKTASGRVVTPTRALAFDADQLKGICQTDHDLGCPLGWRVAELIAGRLKATRLQMMDIFAPPEER